MLITVEHRVAASPARLSERTREVAAMFGLAPHSRGEAREVTIVPRTEIDLPVPGVALITGPSGSGKSTLLRLVVAACRGRGVRIGAKGADAASLISHEPVGDDDRAVIDLIAPDRPLAEAMELLSLAGLGDAFVMLRRPRELSDGQRFRFEIARLMASARTESADDPAALIVIDEFAATLDRITARNLARSIRRWSDRSGTSFVLATTHEDLADALAPDLLIRKHLDGGVSTESRRRTSAHGVGEPVTRRQREHAEGQHEEAADEFTIEPGSLADYRALAAFHYRSHHPGAATSVLRLVHKFQGNLSEAAAANSPIPAHGSEPTQVGESTLVGVLVRSLPHLSCAARDVALNGPYATLSPRERGIAVNREVRCISRVVIDPRFRGMSLAVRLVRHALEHPENPAILYSEALAAMGRVSPFFERAGMRRIDLAQECRPAHARLLDALDAVGLTVGDLSGDGGITLLGTLDPRRARLLVSEARRFVRATRRLPRTTLAAMSDCELLAAAATRLMLQPVYYLFSHRAGREQISRKFVARGCPLKLGEATTHADSPVTS